MNWVTAIWSLVASACLTLALVHLVTWWRQAGARVNLVFALSAVSTALFAGCELWMMKSRTSAEYGVAVRWLHLPVPGIIVILACMGWVEGLLVAWGWWPSRTNPANPDPRRPRSFSNLNTPQTIDP